MRVLIHSIIFLLFFIPNLRAQESILDAGFRVQKTANLYFENGFSFQYSDKRLLPDKLYFGFTYVSSRLGSAMNSNAIKQDNFLFSGAWYFRPEHTFRPVLRLNLGYFRADYEEAIFDVLPNTSFLLSPEFGASFETKWPLKFLVTFGYNLITGDGIDGPGTLYPLFIETTVSWNILGKLKEVSGQ